MAMQPSRLRRLVRHRERLERLQEQEVAAALRVLAIRERALAEARSAREQLLGAGALEGPVDPPALAAAVDYLRRLDREIGAKEAAVRHSVEDVQAERETLRERSRDRKAMESLLEHALEQERLERNRRERIALDDVAGRRWLDGQ